MTPFISVWSTVRNARPWIGMSIGSVVSQRFTDWEMWLVDDASDDGTDAIAWGWADADARVHVVRRQEPAGKAANYLLLRGEMRGQVWVELDGDDWLHGADVLEFIAGNYATNPSLDATFGGAMLYPHGTVNDHRAPMNCYDGPPGKRVRTHGVMVPWLRTMRASLTQRQPESMLIDPTTGKYWSTSADTAINGWAAVHARRVARWLHPLYCYNDTNPASDGRLDREGQLATAARIEQMYREEEARVYGALL